MSIKMLRLPTVMSLLGLARSTIYLRISQGLLTEPVSLGGRAVGWPETEIESLNSARISGMSNDEIQKLVIQLHARRRRKVSIIIGRSVD